MRYLYTLLIEKMLLVWLAIPARQGPFQIIHIVKMMADEAPFRVQDEMRVIRCQVRTVTGVVHLVPIQMW